jgi:hypothetical protein
MPELVKLLQENDSLRAVGWHIGNGSPENVERVVRRQNLTFPVIMTPGKDEMYAWGGEHQPAVTLVDRKGRVRYRGLLPGEAEERARELLRE